MRERRAIVLNSFVKGGVSSAPIRQMVRWLMLARDKGRWGNTQENAYAMEALVNYYRAYEAETPNFTASVKLGETELARAQFQGRSTNAQKQQLPMAQLMAAAPAGSNQPLTFTREGTGTLFYTARLRYAIDQFFAQGLDVGFKVERRYELFEGAEEFHANIVQGRRSRARDADVPAAEGTPLRCRHRSAARRF